ncbi:MAG: glucose 1-dehydrogenase [Myxococcota bacterium]
MGKRFEEKTVVVTGAAAGIGKAAALAFGREGARVLVADLDAHRAEETAETIRKAQGEAIAMRVDVSIDEEVGSMIDTCVESYGGLDIAFNNAGIEGKAAPTHECTYENWERTLAVNLLGTWLCMRHEIPRMLERGGGSIINMSSVAGLAGIEQMPAYVAAKHGVIGLTKTAALELADKGIRVNAVCPGAIRTEMVERYTGGSCEAMREMEADEPMRRLGSPEEVAETVLFLAGEGASFITGHALAVDGGMLAD